jgi:hypothetical protein
VSAGDPDTAALTSNRLTWSGARPKFERHDGSGWHLHFADRTLVNGWAAGRAAGLAVVHGGSLHDRLGVCTAPHCNGHMSISHGTGRAGSARQPARPGEGRSRESSDGADHLADHEPERRHRTSMHD